MTERQVSVMWLGITQLEAQETLVRRREADWPTNFKKSDKQKEHKQLYKLAYPKRFEKECYVDAKDVFNIINVG